MGLEGILNAQTRTKILTDLVETAKKDPLADVVKLYTNYALTYGPLTDEEKERYYVLKREEKFPKLIAEGFGREKTALIQATAENFDEALKAVPEKELFSVAYKLTPVLTEDKEHDAIAQLHAEYALTKDKIEKGDLSPYLDNLKARNPVAYASFKKDLSKEELAVLAKGHVARIKAVLDSAFIFQEGKNKGKVNVNALRSYIASSIDKYDEGSKKKAYELVGNNVRVAD